MGIYAIVMCCQESSIQLIDFGDRRYGAVVIIIHAANGADVS
jgi:hypothetical protein